MSPCLGDEATSPEVLANTADQNQHSDCKATGWNSAMKKLL